MKNSRYFLVFLLGLFTAGHVYASTAASSLSPAEKSLINLNNTMFGIYDEALNQFKTNLLDKTPVIVARFSTEGGHFTLYRPHQTPLVAEFPAVTYQIAKSVGHSVMITYNMLRPYIHASAADKSWRKNVSLFQGKVNSALKNIDALAVSDSDKQVFRQVLTLINNTLTACLKKGSITEEDLNQFTVLARPFISKLIIISSSAQVERQMAVLAEWKKLLGSEWDKAYALTNTIYVTRQNNMIFSMLAEWMGKEAINHRIFLFETTSFTTTDQDILTLWSRIMFDRQLGEGFFGDYYLMDSELIANGGRAEIVKTAKQYNLPDILPELEPFNSTDWPWRHNPSSGTGPASLSEEPDFQFKTNA